VIRDNVTAWGNAGREVVTMFSLMPSRKARKEGVLVPEGEECRIVDDLDFLFGRLLDGWLDLHKTWDLPRPWSLQTEESDKEVVVRAELPGFEVGELDLLLTGDVLTIKAAHEEEVREKEGKRERVERRTTRKVRRTLTLPSGVDPTKVEAGYRNGVLELRFPRLPDAVGRRIEVKP
jgi:HSP20 family protein